jgi:hypothetical protein
MTSTYSNWTIFSVYPICHQARTSRIKSGYCRRSFNRWLTSRSRAAAGDHRTTRDRFGRTSSGRACRVRRSGRSSSVAAAALSSKFGERDDRNQYSGIMFEAKTVGNREQVLQRPFDVHGELKMKISKAIFTNLALALLMLIQPSQAIAQGWDRLPDGRIAIVIKGHKFALPSKGYDADNIRFDDDSLQDRATLPEVIESPEKARALFERRAYVTTSIGVGSEKGLFWNRYDRKTLQSLSFSFVVGENQGNCQDWTAEFERARDSPGQGATPSGVIWREYRRNNTSIYTYAGPKLDGLRKDLQSIYCDVQSYCGSSICLAPDLSFIFSFSSKPFPQEKWLELLKNVDTILASIIETPEGAKGDNR